MESIIALPNDYIVCDIESTGTDIECDEITEITALKYRDNKLVDSFSSLIKINQELDPFIIELTGITDELLKEKGRDLKEVLNEFINFINDDYLIFHNFSFDVRFLKYDVKRLLNIEFEPRCICTLRLSRKRFKRFSDCSLTDIAKEYKIDTTGNHRATKDCEITNEIYQHLKDDLLNEYGSIEGLKESFKHNGKKFNINDVEVDWDNINEDNPFFQKHACITGKLEKMDRNTAQTEIAKLGGLIDESITKQTNYLIEANKIDNTVDGKSNKQKEVEKKKLKGQDIDLIKEKTFYEILEEFKK